ncbi:MAG TPA: nitronate monooxygenase [Pseudonocardia sp.]|jgi:enoyl-[acyl-carrier protein] reductase II
MTWNTPLTELFGVRYPIMQAGMGQVAGGRLAAAVTNAGGIGCIGASRMSPEQFDEEIALAQSLTDGPFGVDFLFPDIDDSTGPAPDAPYHAVDPKLRNTMLHIAYDRRVALIVYAMKLQEGRADEAHELGIKVMTLVGTARHAVRAQERGADAVIATGTEAGGHTGAVALTALVPAVRRAVDIPVVASGGIATGQGVASALALGAAGVWVGTRFMATREAQVHPAVHKEIMDRSEDQTVISRALSGKTCRLATNNFTAYWSDREIKPFPQQAIDMNKMNYVQRSLVEGDVQDCPLPMGQSTGLIDDILGADEVVDNLVREAEETVRNLTTMVGAPETVAR